MKFLDTSDVNEGLCVCAKSLQSCLSLCNPMNRNPPGSSVHGSLQARILKWVAMPFSGGGGGRGIFLTWGIEPRSPALQADSLPSEPLRKISGHLVT